MICLAVTSCISLVVNGLKRWRSVMWNWHYWLYLQEKDGVPLTPQVKVSSLRNNCSFPHPLSYSEKAHSDSSGLFLTHHSILKEACSAALFEVHILRLNFYLKLLLKLWIRFHFSDWNWRLASCIPRVPGFQKQFILIYMNP